MEIRKLKISSRRSSCIKIGTNSGNQEVIQKPIQLFGKDFLDMTPKKEATKEKIYINWTTSKFKSSVIAIETRQEGGTPAPCLSQTLWSVISSRTSSSLEVQVEFLGSQYLPGQCEDGPVPSPTYLSSVVTPGDQPRDVLSSSGFKGV